MQGRRLRVPEEAADLIRTLHPVIKRKVKSSLQAILNDPGAGKSLREELEGLRSFRMGKMRIIYRVSSREIIEIVAIGPRKTIYEETLRLLKRGK